MLGIFGGLGLECQLAVVEMCEGDYKNIRQIIVTPNINVEGLREDWCLDYCHAHDMSVTTSDQYFTPA
ncbi:hypothetical protein [Candidatus Paracaedibacter symbiosus]|uniref:hypothetical protein n=1 Tax=Candidatus Paracaedibacter symbiosus TaxID=244582 RepID=UPI0005099FAD|nr:hypothetical protein [Candidatus Paracaedibacter symbiosus]